MTTTEIFLIAMAIIFTVPYLIWRLGRTDYYAPLVVVQIMTGILLGPGILGKLFPGLLRLRLQPAGGAVAQRHRLVGGHDVRLDRRHRAGPEQGLGAPAREQHHGRTGAGHAAAVRLRGRRRHADGRGLDRARWAALAVRRGRRHGLRRDRPADPDLADGKTRHPAPADRPAHPALRQPGRHRHLGRAGADPDGLGARRQTGRVSARLRRARLRSSAS